MKRVDERFWARVQKTETCWIWTGATSDKGYGVISEGGRGAGMKGVHRMSYIMSGRIIRRGMMVRHTCDNPPCVNPDHLVTGTQFDNMRDMAVRGRAWKQRLTPNQVLEIRALAESGVYHRVIADQFGVSKSNVGMIVNRQSWAWLEGGIHEPVIIPDLALRIAE